MSTFSLKIVTPYGVQFDGEAEELIVRTTSGDVGILPGHTNYVAPLGMGQATVQVNGEKRYGACIGGMISVVGGNVHLVPTTFEWADEIDVDRALDSKSRAEKVLADKNATDAELVRAKARLMRSLVRTGVADRRKRF